MNNIVLAFAILVFLLLVYFLIKKVAKLLLIVSLIILGIAAFSIINIYPSIIGLEKTDSIDLSQGSVQFYDNASNQINSFNQSNISDKNSSANSSIVIKDVEDNSTLIDNSISHFSNNSLIYQNNTINASVVNQSKQYY